MDVREPLKMSPPPHASGGVVSGGSNTYGAGVTNNSNNSMGLPNSAGMSPGMRLSFDPINSAPSKPMDTTASLFHGDGVAGMRQGGGMFTMSGDQLKKKRGRPRKYGPDGSMALALIPNSGGSGYSDGPSSDPMGKKRGRPIGSGKKQQLEALGSAGIAFTPHIITVKAGEDVASKIMAFSQQGARTICILSANGAINNVTLRQPATSGGTVTYEGRFEIISLSGSYLLTEDGTTRSRTGGLSVSLAGSDGRVLGGGVAGMLLAATPVQLVVGSFIADGKKPKPEPVKREQPSSAPPPMAVCSTFGAATVTGATMTGSPPSEGTSSESSGDPSSPMHHNGGHYSTSNQHLHSTFPPVDWAHSASQMRHDSEIKMMPN